MTSEIIVETKEVYGNKLVYCTSEHSDSIQALTNRKTLTPKDLKALSNLGFSFKMKAQELEIN